MENGGRQVKSGQCREKSGGEGGQRIVERGGWDKKV